MAPRDRPAHRPQPIDQSPQSGSPPAYRYMRGSPRFATLLAAPQSAGMSVSMTAASIAWWRLGTPHRRVGAPDLDPLETQRLLQPVKEATTVVRSPSRETNPASVAEAQPPQAERAGHRPSPRCAQSGPAVTRSPYDCQLSSAHSLMWSALLGTTACLLHLNQNHRATGCQHQLASEDCERSSVEVFAIAILPQQRPGGVVVRPP